MAGSRLRCADSRREMAMQAESAADDLDFVLDGIRFKVLIGEYQSRVTDSDGVVLLKTAGFAREEIRALGSLEVANMLELGIWQGGSAVLWPLLLPLEHYVGIDINSVDITFPPEVTEHPRWQTVRLHGGVSQGDRVALDRIIEDEFDGPLDLVLDDASHHYEMTRSSFETCFPHVRPGGAYIIEDWAWAHWPGDWQEPDHRRAGQPALSNLVLELVLLAASRPDVITTMTVNTRFAVASRGPADLTSGLEIDDLLMTRGKKLSLL